VLTRLSRQTGSVELHLASATGARFFSKSFVYYAPESIISAAPSRGDAAGGLRVTITGTGFTLLSGPPCASPPRTNWTRLVLPPVLSGHVSSFPPY